MTTQLKSILGSVVLDAALHPLDPVPEIAPCGLRWFGDPSATYKDETCTGKWHYLGDHAKGRCPEVAREEQRARFAAERERLEGELARLTVAGFSGFEPDRYRLIGGARALDVMQRFASARPPRFSVLLKGPTGLGKTHLLLASHFELLAGGVASEYVTTVRLRRWFDRVRNFDEEISSEARGHLDRITYAAAVHFDDAGHVEGDQRKRGEFAEGLKDLLDRSRGRWAVSTNRSATEAEQHPDMTGTIVSRLLQDCEIVELDGPDYRSTTARRA